MTSILASAYLYGLYAYLSGGLLLQGRWDFIGHPLWPATLVWLRDQSVLVFLGSGGSALFCATRNGLRNWKSA